MTQKICRACVCLLAGVFILAWGIPYCYGAETEEMPKEAAQRSADTKCMITLPATPVDIYVPEIPPGTKPTVPVDPIAPGPDEPDVPDQPDQPGKDDPAPDTPDDTKDSVKPVKPVQGNTSKPDTQGEAMTHTSPVTGDESNLAGYAAACMAAAILLYKMTRRRCRTNETI